MKIRVQSSNPMGFFRLGSFWPAEGKVVDQADFSETQWEVLTAEPNLRVSVVKEEVLIDETDLRDRVLAALSELPVEGFGEDGVPRLTALQAALPDLIPVITPQLRDDLWAQAALIPTMLPAAELTVEVQDAPAAEMPAQPATETATDPVVAETATDPVVAEASAPLISIEDQIRDAFTLLSEADFMTDGRPKVAAIQALLAPGADIVTAEQRDALWAEFVPAQSQA